MTATLSAPPIQQDRVHPPERTRRANGHRVASERHRDRPSTGERRPLGSYVSSTGRAREIVTRPGSGGSVLVLDRDATTLGDRRLVAHLAADEPDENAAIVCGCYLTQAQRGRCRLLKPEDLCIVPFTVESDLEVATTQVRSSTSRQVDPSEVDRRGCGYRLERLSTGMSIPELRWCCGASADGDCERRPMSMREVVACLESYEPVCGNTREALREYHGDGTVSTAVLRVELARMQESPIVLNRGLREAVLDAVERQGLSMSEIAMRCGRVKRDSAGNASGETSWLSRRLGLLPEGGRDAPTPWVHSDVLALIARDGLGVGPREVEVG
jgi:hypothetical protein